MNNVIAESFRILTWWVCWCYYSSWSGHQFTDHYCFCYLFFTCNKQANMYIYIDKSQSLTMLKIYNCPCCPLCTRASNTINQSILARSVHVHTQPPLFIVCIFSHCMCKMNCGHFFLIGQYSTVTVTDTQTLALVVMRILFDWPKQKDALYEQGVSRTAQLRSVARSISVSQHIDWLRLRDSNHGYSLIFFFSYNQPIETKLTRSSISQPNFSIDKWLIFVSSDLAIVLSLSTLTRALIFKLCWLFQVFSIFYRLF